MRRSRVLVLGLALLLAICLLGGCSATGAIRSGIWDGNTFTNEWSNIKVPLQEGWTSLSAEQMESVLGAGTDVLVNDGATNEKSSELAKKRTIYDFMLMAEDGISSVYLCYENISMIPGGSKFGEEDYLNNVKEGLAAVQQITYSFGDMTKETLGGQEYTVLPASVNDGLMLQKYYVRKQDKAFIGWIVSYTPDSEQVVNGQLQAVTKVK